MNILYQMVSPVNIHTSNVIRTEQMYMVGDSEEVAILSKAVMLFSV